MTTEPKQLARILIVDDEESMLKAMSDTLKKENFSVTTAATGKEGLEKAVANLPDLILLDLRLPDIDGYDVCRELKKGEKTSHLPVIIVSTRILDTEKIIGLELGADDYITKPYNPLELIARIRAVLRRFARQEALTEESKKTLNFGLVSVDTEYRKVTVNSKAVKLTRKEFDLLEKFISKPGKPYSRHALMTAVWGYAYDSLQGTVDSHIGSLRKKLGEAGKLIETVPGIGYRWAEE